ncbi:hypothetical protein VTN77DRAFT_4881 [Rasamsonia byssochlamydoides]|uniref:uncharacterized protein n=1 Tax=Rasamsonia byssochlamydoides TaxID=89139 RepID=UPI003743543D
MASYIAFSRALAPSKRLLTYSRRFLSSTPARRVADDNKRNPFLGGPAPPRLPKEEQEIFEELQRQSTGAFSTPRTPPKVNQSPHSEEAASSAAASSATTSASASARRVDFDSVEDLHPNLRLGAKPEFEGDKNPKTGEIGGPKTEPLRWGHNGDWSYSGRVTDF